MPITKWTPQIVIENTLKAQEVRMLRAVVAVVGNVKRLINRSNQSGDNPSLPGEPPKKVSGDLYRSINGQVARVGNQIIGRVGANHPAARRLELGFVGRDSRGRNYSQAPRPYLRPGLYMSKATIARILGAKK